MFDYYEVHREAARIRYGSATPYRLGIAVGLAGSNLPPPYGKLRPAHRHYLEGVKEGKRLASLPDPNGGQHD